MTFIPNQNVKIVRIDKSIDLPVYETQGSVGFDILARIDCKVSSKEIVLVPANLIIEVPKGYMLVIASRSSTPLKKGLTPPHGLGIIDHDYCGPQDEIKVMVYNFSEDEVLVKKGDKIAQGVFVRVDKFKFEEVDQIKNDSRGGFGSTGGM